MRFKSRKQNAKNIFFIALSQKPLIPFGIGGFFIVKYNLLSPLKKQAPPFLWGGSGASENVLLPYLNYDILRI